MIKVAIIGSGFGQYGLLPAFRSVKNCKVVGLVGKKKPQLIAYCKKIGFKDIYSDWRELLKQQKPNAIALAVTPQAQYEIAKTVINEGLHVFAEKPLTATVSQAEELLTLAKQKKIIHGIDFIFPEIAAWKKVKHLLDHQTYGKLEHISVNWDFLSYDIRNKHTSWKTDATAGGGALSFFFSHGLYYLEHFAGRISNVHSIFSNASESMGGAEAGAHLLLSFASGTTGNARVYANSRGLTRHQVIFFCEKAVLVLENFKNVVDNFTLKKYSPKRTHMLKIKKDRGIKNEDERVKIVQILAERFIQCCTTNKQMYPSFTEGLRVQTLIEMIRSQHG